MSGVSSYRLSRPAKKDIEAIFDYTVGEHNLSQARYYISSFHDVFIQIAANPFLGRSRTDIKHGLYSISHKEHVVFYRVLKHYVRIVRVLHHSRNINRLI